MKEIGTGDLGKNDNTLLIYQSITVSLFVNYGFTSPPTNSIISNS